MHQCFTESYVNGARVAGIITIAECISASVIGDISIVGASVIGDISIVGASVIGDISIVGASVIGDISIVGASVASVSVLPVFRCFSDAESSVFR
jgi:hypothetical protein